MALIGGLLIVGIGVFILGLLTDSQNPNIPSDGAFDSFFVLPLEQAFVTIYLAFFFAAPIWLLFYLPCHLLTPRTSVLWRPWACVPLGALAGAAAYWAELSWITWGHDLNDGPWIQYQAILAACVGASTCLAGSTIVKRWREKEKRILAVGSEQP